jgi:hypothetical protein
MMLNEASQVCQAQAGFRYLETHCGDLAIVALPTL